MSLLEVSFGDNSNFKAIPQQFGAQEFGDQELQVSNYTLQPVNKK